MQIWKLIVALPVVVLLVLIGAMVSNTSSGWDLFPYAWFSLVAAFTVAFIAMMRWGFGPDQEEGSQPEANAEPLTH